MRKDRISNREVKRVIKFDFQKVFNNPWTFYQPPRENPWLEEIEIQDSARPFHDWNERVSYECYEPNSVSRIVDDRNRILDIVNNYQK